MSLYEELWALWEPCRRGTADGRLVAFTHACDKLGLKIEAVLVPTLGGESVRAEAWLVSGVMYFPFDK